MVSGAAYFWMCHQKADIISGKRMIKDEYGRFPAPVITTQVSAARPNTPLISLGHVTADTSVRRTSVSGADPHDGPNLSAFSDAPKC